MPGYLGDVEQRTIHRADGIASRCLAAGLDLARVTEIRSDDLRDWLLRGERWHACPRCLPDLGPQRS